METNSGIQQSKRLLSLDALRGFDMLWIIGGAAIFKNLAKPAGGVFEMIAPQFEHVPWEGLHFYDLIWPLFMFIVGVSIPLSIEKRRAAGQTKRVLYIHAVRRAVILFIIGMALQGGLLKWDLSQLHPCYSVLHGIAAGYLIAVILVLELRPKMQLIMTVIFLLLYWAILEMIPVPGVGAGVLTPQGNIATYVDQLILGRFHYGENTWFLSYPAFASSVLMGVMASHLLKMPYSQKTKVILLTGAGTGSIVVGLLWSLFFPIIKLLWTSSFVLVAGGIAFLLLAFFYWIIDVKGYRSWSFFFRVIGMNSLAVYTATELMSFRPVGNIFVGSLLPRIQPWGEFISSTFALAIVWLILYWMYKTKSFVKL